MEAYSNFQYYTDNNDNSHSAGYMFNEKCMQSGGGKKYDAMKNLAVPGGLFFDEKKSVLKNKSVEKGLINSFNFDKLFNCTCLDENKSSKKNTKKNNMKSNKRKTRRS